MKKFGDLLAVLDLLEENMETRAKAKDFKTKMGPLIKRVRDAQIGDGRRYAYMLVWDFLRDVLQVAEMQGQDRPVNSALIQRKLEELSDSGQLPPDAGDRFEQFANEQYDNFVNQISITRPKHRGEEVGFSPEESASDRAARTAREREEASSAPPEDPGFKLGVDLEEIDQEFRSVVSDIKDSLDRRSSTSIIEIFFNPADGPIVQKKQIAALFKLDELADDIEINSDKIVIELKPDSPITKQIKLTPTDQLEDIITNQIEKITGREVRVVIHAPEPGGTYEPKVEAPAEKPGAAALDYYYPESSGRGGRPVTGEFPVDVPGKGTFIITMQNGNVIDVQNDQFDPSLINVQALDRKIKLGHRLKDALITSFNTRGGADTQALKPQTNAFSHVESYIPDEWKRQKAREDANPTPAPEIQTTRERFRPKTNHQLAEYRRMMGTYAQPN